MKVRYHPDGWIYVDGYQISLAEAALVVPGFSVPPDTLTLDYEAGRKSIKTDLNGAQKPGPEAWNSADLLSVDWPEKKALIEASRIPTPTPPVPDPETEACREIVTRWDTATKVEQERVLKRMAQRIFRV